MRDWIIEADIHRLKRELHGETNRVRREGREDLLRTKEAQLRHVKSTGPQPWLPRRSEPVERPRTIIPMPQASDR